MLKVIAHLCPQNHPCPAVRVCPVDALTQNGLTAPDVNQELCIDCGKCTRVCPTKALQLIFDTDTDNS